MSWAKFVHILSRTKASLIPMTRSQTLTFLSQYFAFLHHEASNYGIHSCSKYMYIECSCRSLALLVHCQYFWFFLICTMYCNLIKNSSILCSLSFEDRQMKSCGMKYLNLCSEIYSVSLKHPTCVLLPWPVDCGIV